MIAYRLRAADGELAVKMRAIGAVLIEGPKAWVGLSGNRLAAIAEAQDDPPADVVIWHPDGPPARMSASVIHPDAESRQAAIGDLQARG